ncbi:MAG: signal recognition particle protein [Chloroflexi bacterium]|nr:signal recognition particle protein [Chloroflexota bacterium]
MFESLSEKLNGAFSRLTGKGSLSEKDIDEALREVRLSLLEADVDFKVTRSFVSAVKERATQENLFASLTPGQTVVRIVNEELVNILGGEAVGLERGEHAPTVIMLVGLQGVGKTTAAAKLARWFNEQGESVALAACDLRRPAAIEQLVQLGDGLGVHVYREDPEKSTPLQVAKNAVKEAERNNTHYLILDTSGRIAIDDELMRELEEIRDATNPIENLLVVDAMTGQDAVRSGTEFQERIGLTGIIMTKMDGDARGGAALSMRSVTGVPIKFIGVSERPDGLEQFHPDRLASRILGMGDMQTLIEKAEQQFDVDQAEELERKLRSQQFDMNDMLQQLQTFKKMGGMADILGMIPGMGSLKGRMNPKDLDESRITRVEGIIHSMTPVERANPKLINGSRRKRIADGSGTTASDVNQLLGQFRQMQKMMKKISSGKGRRAVMSMLEGR